MILVPYMNNFIIFVINNFDMKGIVKIGKLGKDDILTIYKKASREMELENSTGWISKHKVHKSIKDYSRKTKHKNLEY